jgi:phosphoribosylamine---glycine ligase
MKVLVVGGGGREHAIGWTLSRSAACSELLFAPGNGGTSQLGRNLPIEADYLEGIVAVARGEAVDLVVVGPEAPLVAGLADQLATYDIPVFGPGAAAAQLEGSKAFAKEFLRSAGIPTAEHAVFTDAAAAVEYIHTVGAPIVVKADGLAAGKGVVVAETVEEACDAAEAMLSAGRFGAAGRSIVIEEHLEGPEATVMVLVSGNRYELLATSRDHKRAGDGDTGPNTGGMGAVCPAPGVDDQTLTLVRETIIEPTIAELGRRNLDYRGLLYVGLMLTPLGPHVIEFNVRFGDPETQVVLPRLESDLLETLHAVACGTYWEPLEWSDEVAVGVVLAAPGYPGAVQVDERITIDEHTEGLVFHAGTRLVDGHLVSSGGRILSAVGCGPDVDAARATAYRTLSAITCPGAWSRADIAQEPTLALAR